MIICGNVDLYVAMATGTGDLPNSNSFYQIDSSIKTTSGICYYCFGMGSIGKVFSILGLLSINRFGYFISGSCCCAYQSIDIMRARRIVKKRIFELLHAKIYAHNPKILLA